MKNEQIPDDVEPKRPASLKRRLGMASLALVAVTVPPYVTYTMITQAAESRRSNADFMAEQLGKGSVKRPTSIACKEVIYSDPDILGITSSRTNKDWPYHITFKQSVCNDVRDYAAKDNKTHPTDDQLLALLTVVHETEHVNAGGKPNQHNEAELQCKAFQNVDDFAEVLGASREEALQAQEQLVPIYLNFPNPNYLTPVCYDEGPYDVDPTSEGLFPYQTP